AFGGREEKRKWAEKGATLCDRISNEITKLYPYEKLRLKVVHSRLLLELFGLQPDNKVIAETAQNITYQSIKSEYYGIGQLFDYALLMATRIEAVETTASITEKSQLELAASEGVSQGLILVPILEKLSRDSLSSIGTMLIGSLSSLVPHIRGTEVTQACQTIMKLADGVLRAGENSFLTESSKITGNYFMNLAKGLLAIGTYSIISNRNRKRAIQSSEKFSEQAMAIFDFVSSESESVESRIVRISAGYQHFFLTIDNQEPESEFLSVLIDNISLSRETTETAISLGLFPMLVPLIRLLLDSLARMRNGLSEGHFLKAYQEFRLIRQQIEEKTESSLYPALLELLSHV
ncbi:MAG TPA: hypothetical protein VJ044_08625, partial [Candidatus Hodarchaeales archaeon]|nr:hypothetical protein [Candidatus Hodarchaeales archaeon]